MRVARERTCDRGARQARALEGDHIPVLDEGVVLQAHPLRAHESGEDVLERSTIELAGREEVAVDLADGLPVSIGERAKDAPRAALLRLARRAMHLRDAGVGRAHVALPAGRSGVVLVAEVFDEQKHPADALLGIAPHARDLLEPVRALPLVGLREVGVAAADRLVGLDARAPVQPQLLERLLEDRRRKRRKRTRARPSRAALALSCSNRSRAAMSPPGSRARGRTRASCCRRTSGRAPRARELRRGRRARFPGSSPRASRAAPCGSPCARRACRCPSRTRSSRRRLRCLRSRKRAGRSAREAAGSPAWYGDRADLGREPSASASASRRVGA